MELLASMQHMHGKGQGKGQEDQGASCEMKEKVVQRVQLLKLQGSVTTRVILAHVNTVEHRKFMNIKKPFPSCEGLIELWARIQQPPPS